MDINVLTDRESPVETRKSLIIVDQLKKTGIPFVAIPVLNDVDRKWLQSQVGYRLEIIDNAINKSQRKISFNDLENEIIKSLSNAFEIPVEELTRNY